MLKIMDPYRGAYAVGMYDRNRLLHKYRSKPCEAHAHKRPLVDLQNAQLLAFPRPQTPPPTLNMENMGLRASFCWSVTSVFDATKAEVQNPR